MSVLRELKGLGARLLESPWVERAVRPDYPPFAVELTTKRVIGVAVERGRGGARLAGHAFADLPEGAFSPSLLQPPVADPAALRAALADVIGSFTGFEGRLSLALPDHVGKVSFVELERTGMTVAEQAEVIRWKLKRSTPFRIEDATLSFQSFPEPGGKVRSLVLIVQSTVIDQLEAAFVELGVEVGLIDLSCFHLWNLVEPRLATSGDVLLVNVGDPWLTAIISRAGVPLMQRCKTPTGGAEAWWPELRQEMGPTLLYYQDRIGGPGIERALVRGPTEVVDDVRKYLADERGIPTDALGTVGLMGAEGMSASEQVAIAPAVGAALGR